MVFADRLVAITPEGDLLNLSEDGDREATRRFEDAFASGNVVDFDVIKATGGPLCTWTASITFGGKDLKTAYLGRSAEHTSELQSLMRLSYAVFCLTTNNNQNNIPR